MACDLNRCFQGMTDPKGNKNMCVIMDHGKIIMNPFIMFINSVINVFNTSTKSFTFTRDQIRTIQEMTRVENEAYARAMKTFKRYKRIGIVEIRGPYASYVGNRLLDEHSDIDIAAMMYARFDSVSLRSREDFDMSVIPGFKGHKHAGVISKKDLNSLISKE